MKIQEIYSLAFATITLYMILLSYIVYRKQNRKKERLKVINDTMTFCFDDKTNYENLIYQEMFSYKLDGDALNTNQLQVLATFDKISIALKNKVFDENIIIDYYGKYFIHFYYVSKYFILKRREMTKNPDLFIEYEMLVRRWENYNLSTERRFENER
jgi:hypothetical protein